MIEGVRVKRLNRRCDERGFFLEVLRDDDGLLRRFGQTSYTLSYPGVIKAFHWHVRQDDLWFVASGNALVVLYDRREGSPTRGELQELVMGEQDPILLLIPAGVAHGYKVLGDRPVGLFYHTTHSYDREDPDEMRIPYDDPSIGFDWEKS
jgi:dTDP-4-dehydrorhamnose 3,5-epimerase